MPFTTLSLRTRLFLILAGLVAALVVAQWWLMTSLSRALDRELDSVALAVSGSVASFFTFDPAGDPAGGGDVTVLDRTFEPGEMLFSPDDPDVAHLPNPEELQEYLEEKGVNRAHSLVVRRVVTGTGEDEEGAERSPHNVRIHIERAPEARFLWLVSPGSKARVPLPETGLDDKIEDFRRRMLLGSGLVLALGLLLAGAVAHRVSAPLRRLATAAEEVGDGAFGTQVDAESGDRELASTLGAFNRMSSRLAELDARARKLSALRHLGEIGDVARGLAHALRNPLNALGLSVEELSARASESDPEGAGSLAESARRQIQRMDRGIRSFLVLASPGGGKVARLDLGGLARDVALEALQDGGGRVRVQARVAAEGAAISAIEAELRAVLQALVVNAVEASPDGGEVEVRVAPSAAAGVRIEVLDRGPGLADEVRRRLFTPHVSTKSNGSGMGLFLAHRLATERYGGSLELLDREGGGTRAVLTLGDRLTESEMVESDPAEGEAATEATT